MAHVDHDFQIIEEVLMHFYNIFVIKNFSQYINSIQGGLRAPGPKSTKNRK